VIRFLAATTSIFLTCVGSLAGQVTASSDATRLHASRADLKALFEQYEALAESPAYSGASRQDARETASQIQTRLEQGDFHVGDRIVLNIRGETEIPDTVQVEPGPVVVLGLFGEISLAGVLRSELQTHLTRELSRHIREPVVYSRSMIRLAIDGQIGMPGFYVLPADMLLGEALMSAGGPAADADMNKIRVFRGESILLTGDAIADAIVDGRSLDQLNLRAGDRIEVGARGFNPTWGAVLRYGIPALSLLVFGVRLF
jgi:protein involved in polysaccharide export with SLBB domain